MLSVKASLLLLYLRISPRVIFRRIVKSLLVLFTLDAIVFSGMAMFQCSPVDRAWLWTKPGRCNNRELLYKAQGLWSLFQNLVIIFLPVPTVLKLQMSRRRRALLLLVFAVGLMYVLKRYTIHRAEPRTEDDFRPCAAVIARVVPTSPPALYKSDLTWWLVESQDWIAVETGSGMICASLILLKPLINVLFPKVLGGSLHRSRRRAAAIWPGQAKRSQSTNATHHRLNHEVVVPTLPMSHHTNILLLDDRACPGTADSPRPCSYLEGLQSPDLESAPIQDPFSQLAS